jgi:1-pyrroline-5-carboxylate dehydrogenase
LDLPDPLNGEIFMKVSDTKEHELGEFIKNSKAITKSGLHNAFKNPERYVHYGTVCAEAAALLRTEHVREFFIKLIQRVAPKSYQQAKAELHVTERFLQNFSGDQVRFLAKAFQVPGDHTGQISSGYRWPYGPVSIIAPFNFPIEIPILQLMGALFMGNRVTIKGDSRVSVVLEQTIRMLLHCGLPAGDLDFINCDGPVMHSFLMKAQPRVTQFTGSSKVGEFLAKELNGKVKLEDAGWDWKVIIRHYIYLY